jgi:1-acyl-sn-glycerol-3-phosphate acyltransferase
MKNAIVPQARGFRDGHPFYRLSQLIVAAVLRSLASVEAEGMDLCPPPGSGPVLLASNHLSMVDIPLVAAWAPRPVIFFSKTEVLHTPVIGGISAFYGTIFVRRGEADRQAIREALGCLAAGQIVGVFPEGHRSPDGALQRGQPGIALLAQRAAAQIWPVAVSGTPCIGHARRPRVAVRGGAPFDAVALAREAHGPAASHADVVDVIMRRIAVLLPAERRGAFG